ncbi:aminoglycoside phosphotransferase family protein [Enterovibrio norvegicus]|uniref:hypothetical protein n=1 Tax=Enterovibrio norvegicus TaxID=188144 RepID=UPI003D12E509
MKKLLIKLFIYFLNFYDVLSNLVWLCFAYPFLYISLKYEGYDNICLFRFVDWHLSCRYLLADKGGSKYFVKCGRRSLIYNEVMANQCVKHSIPNSVLNIYGFNTKNWCHYNYCIFDFMNEHIPLSDCMSVSKNDFIILEMKLKKIVNTFKSENISHRDLSPSNIFVNPNKKADLIVIDFAMASGDPLVDIGFTFRKKIILKSLGQNYRPRFGRWDDFYSVDKILSEIEVCD